MLGAFLFFGIPIALIGFAMVFGEKIKTKLSH
jgi:hypothetical protein